MLVRKQYHKMYKNTKLNNIKTLLHFFQVISI